MQQISVRFLHKNNFSAEFIKDNYFSARVLHDDHNSVNQIPIRYHFLGKDQNLSGKIFIKQNFNYYVIFCPS